MFNTNFPEAFDVEFEEYTRLMEELAAPEPEPEPKAEE